MNVFEFEEVHYMCSGLVNCDGSVDVSYWTNFPLQPHLQYENKEAEIGTKLTTEHSKYLLQWMYLNLKKYIAWVQGWEIVMVLWMYYIEQCFIYNPIYNINAKEAEITETITVEDSNWYFHFHQRCLILKKYLCIF